MNAIKQVPVAAVFAIALMAGFATTTEAEAASKKGFFGITVNTGDRHYERGHYEYRTERVLVAPGYYSKHFVPATYETRFDECGHPYRVLVKEDPNEEPVTCVK